MMEPENPIDDELDDVLLKDAETDAPAGAVGCIARRYDISGDRLLGFLLALNYGEMSIVTCDPWKRKCGGVPRNSFVIAKLSPLQVDREDRHFCDRMILGRVTDSVPTPVERDVQSTVFQIHKVQAILDPFTQKELQWSALKASIVGTYYDNDEDDIAFGNDVDTFFAPHAYEVYAPAPDDLELLINSFVRADHAVDIGWLRYTETPPPAGYTSIPVRIDPDDFIGHGSGNRTALFGKTRMGKPNAIKIICDAVFQAQRPAAQLIFDPSGEYTYINEQDGTSLFFMHRDRSVRYSLSPRLPREEETVSPLGFHGKRKKRVLSYRVPFELISTRTFISATILFGRCSRPAFEIAPIIWSMYSNGTR